MAYYQDMAAKLLEQYTLDVNKAAFDTPTAASNGIMELDFAEIIKATNDPQTPLLNAIGGSTARAVTHRWRQYAYRAAATNKHQEGSAAVDSASVIPTACTNTCQIIKGTVEVTGSARQEAANGIYGSNLIDDIAFQLEAETRGIMADLEKALLYGVEDTSDASGSERAMKGLIGAVGTWNGFIQTTRTDANGAAFGQGLIDTLLATIWNAQPGSLPNALLGSLAFCQKVSSYATMMRYNISDPAQLANLPAGQRVSQYVAPWGGVLDIIPTALNVNGASATDNWFAAINTGDLFRADFRPLNRRQLPSTKDSDEYEVLWEGCLECHVQNGMGIVRNFVQIS